MSLPWSDRRFFPAEFVKAAVSLGQSFFPTVSGPLFWQFRGAPGLHAPWRDSLRFRLPSDLLMEASFLLMETAPIFLIMRRPPLFFTISVPIIALLPLFLKNLPFSPEWILLFMRSAWVVLLVPSCFEQPPLRPSSSQRQQFPFQTSLRPSLLGSPTRFPQLIEKALFLSSFFSLRATFFFSPPSRKGGASSHTHQDESRTSLWVSRPLHPSRRWPQMALAPLLLSVFS